MKTDYANPKDMTLDILSLIPRDIYVRTTVDRDWTEYKIYTGSSDAAPCVDYINLEDLQ